MLQNVECYIIRWNLHTHRVSKPSPAFLTFLSGISIQSRQDRSIIQSQGRTVAILKVLSATLGPGPWALGQNKKGGENETFKDFKLFIGITGVLCDACNG